ncbi:MAG: DUF4446 family protein [Eubacteriales bacterium]|nr:MAG: DUF4446 domain-containing protein [Firmicutes bacterium HGW-Firmicutes-8]
MESILSNVKTNIETLALAATCISLISLVLWLVNTWRTSRLIKRYKVFMHGMDGKNLEGMLTTHLDKVNNVLAKTVEVERAYKAVRKMAESSIQNVGIVRFNAFNDIGSDLSFAVALLDHYGDGVVINSIFGRSETRTYAKPVNKGVSSYNLSTEEEEAIRKALENKKE